jgi:hypothetical protein
VADRKLLRVRGSYGSSHFRWVEGFHVETATGETSYGDTLAMQALLYAWFYAPYALGAESRASLMPHVYALQSMVVLTIVGDVIPVAGDLLDAIDIQFALNEADPLPANSSVMIQLQSHFGGRGRYGRIHTAGLTSKDVTVGREYLMPADRVLMYEQVYELLYLMVQSWPGPNAPYRMVNRHGGRIYPSTDPAGKYDLTTGVRIVHPYIGTMQLRSPGHGHGRRSR